jgi:hypothetical protein
LLIANGNKTVFATQSVTLSVNISYNANASIVVIWGKCSDTTARGTVRGQRKQEVDQAHLLLKNATTSNAGCYNVSAATSLYAYRPFTLIYLFVLKPPVTVAAKTSATYCPFSAADGLYKVYTTSHKITLEIEGKEGELCISRNLSSAEKQHFCSAVKHKATYSDLHQGDVLYWTFGNFSTLDEHLAIDVCLQKSCNGQLIGDLCGRGMINCLLACYIDLVHTLVLLQIGCQQIVMMALLPVQLLA